MIFFTIFIIIPLLEIYVFMLVGQEIGLGSTLLFALLTAIIGGYVVKRQGLQTLFSIENTLHQGQVPLSHIFDGLCLLVAGAMLITPGFVTDTIGFLLLFPSFRKFVRHVILNHTNFKFYEIHEHNKRPHDTGAIEGEFERVDEDQVHKKP